jgi:flagellin
MSNKFKISVKHEWSFAMSSILTNSSAQTALRSLNTTNASLEKTQSRISTGYRVASAEDNAAYWSIATTMRSDKSALSTVKDALGLGAATVDVAYTGMNAAIDVAKEIKSKLVAARQPGVDRTKIQSEVTELQNQLTSIADSSVFSGENWLSVDSAATGYNKDKSIVSSFSRAGGAISIGTITVDTSKVKLFDKNGQAGIVDKVGTSGKSMANLDISALTDSAADLTKLETFISEVDAGISSMTSSAATLGSAKQRVNMQKEFVGSLMDAIDRGISTLVDADMTEESTKLQALQVQQQLGVQALSIANQSSQSIISLFR